MSNIFTSYVRIKRKDNSDMTSDEIERLFQGIVRVHDDFGSYWVRIVKKYRPDEKCLDIQYGSGKCTSNLFYSYHAFAKEVPDPTAYIFWERINNEGDTVDSIQRYYSSEEGDDILVEEESRNCKYGFNKIIIKRMRIFQKGKVLVGS